MIVLLTKIHELNLTIKAGLWGNAGQRAFTGVTKMNAFCIWHAQKAAGNRPKADKNRPKPAESRLISGYFHLVTAQFLNVLDPFLISVRFAPCSRLNFNDCGKKCTDQLLL